MSWSNGLILTENSNKIQIFSRNFTENEKIRFEMLLCSSQTFNVFWMELPRQSIIDSRMKHFRRFLDFGVFSGFIYFWGWRNRRWLFEEKSSLFWLLLLYAAFSKIVLPADGGLMCNALFPWHFCRREVVNLSNTRKNEIPNEMSADAAAETTQLN